MIVVWNPRLAVDVADACLKSAHFTKWVVCFALNCSLRSISSTMFTNKKPKSASTKTNVFGLLNNLLVNFDAQMLEDRNDAVASLVVVPVVPRNHSIFQRILRNHSFFLSLLKELSIPLRNFHEIGDPKKLGTSQLEFLSRPL